MTWAGGPSGSHGCRSTLQSCHSLLLHRTMGARAHVTFGVPLAFPRARSGGGGVGWSGPHSAPPQPSARHAASEALWSQGAPHGSSQDPPARTSTVPLQRSLPFTRRTSSRCPVSTRPS